MTLVLSLFNDKVGKFAKLHLFLGFGSIIFFEVKKYKTAFHETNNF